MIPRALSILCLALTATAQDPIPLNFTMTSPGWGGEVITLPPGFAPNMSTKGVEDIRFAPGMFKADAEDFFSYIFVITSTTGQQFDTAFIRSELLLYYQGLAKTVSKGSVDPSGFVWSLTPKKGEALKAAHTGKLDWIEPFATRKPQTLHFDIQVRAYKTAEFLIVCVSPQTANHAIWSSLHKIRDTFRMVQP